MFFCKDVIGPQMMLTHFALYVGSSIYDQLINDYFINSNCVLKDCYLKHIK